MVDLITPATARMLTASAKLQEFERLQNEVLEYVNSVVVTEAKRGCSTAYFHNYMYDEVMRTWLTEQLTAHGFLVTPAKDGDDPTEEAITSIVISWVA